MPDKRILIVEDETIVAMTIEDALQEMGYSVVGTVSTAEDAIKMAGDARPDLILMDIRIQGEKDGIAAAEEITAQYHIPIIYLTAHADEKTFKRAMKTQPYGYLIKPFRDRELHSTIEIALYKHRLLQQRDETEQVAADEGSSPVTAPVPDERLHYPRAIEKKILDMIDLPVFALNREMHLVYFNTALERLFEKLGYLTSRRDQSIFEVASLSFLGNPRDYRAVLESRRMKQSEKTIIVDDRRATYSVIRMPIIEGDTARYVAVILRDVSRELGSEQKLGEIQESYEKMLAQLAEITRITGDDKDPKMQKIAGIISEIVITMAKMNPR
ncbi:MAG: response regulator [Methanoregula sp.]|uniref:response regulator n=1 Tax=Methanoregula sp. TaxID=2052170 RepID=UPI003BB090F8